MQSRPLAADGLDSPLMRRTAAILAFTLIAGIPSLALAATRDGDNAPLFTLHDLGGRTVSLADLHGNIVVMHFAASW